jgi:hypothetical protein
MQSSGDKREWDVIESELWHIKVDQQREEIKRLEAMLAKAKELAEFYADTENWILDEYGHRSELTSDDWYPQVIDLRPGKSCDYVGGKKAVEFLRELDNE